MSDGNNSGQDTPITPQSAAAPEAIINQLKQTPEINQPQSVAPPSPMSKEEARGKRREHKLNKEKRSDFHKGNVGIGIIYIVGLAILGLIGLATWGIGKAIYIYFSEVTSSLANATAFLSSSWEFIFGVVFTISITHFIEKFGNNDHDE